MLTEVDIERIMEAKHQLTESQTEPVGYHPHNKEEKMDNIEHEPSMYELEGCA